MKHFLFTTAMLAIFHCNYAQEFCGHIKYKYRYFKGKKEKEVTSKVKDVKIEDFYICDNNFKIYFDGKLKDIYIGDSNVYVLDYAGDDVYKYVKANSAYGEISPNYSTPLTNQKYNGKDYKMIKELTGNTTYYYNDSIRINKSRFEVLELFHWNKFFDATDGGLRLVSRSKDGRLTSISEAIEVNFLNSTDIDFKLPDKSKLNEIEWITIKREN